MTHMITRTYDRFEDARAVVHKLKAAGFTDSDIKVMAHEDHHREDIGTDVDSPSGDGSAAGTGATVGAGLGGAAGLLTGLGLMAIPGVGPLVAAGWLATTAAGAVAGAVTGAAAGGVVGALTDSGIDKADAETYAEAVRRGAILISVDATDTTEAHVRSVMDSNRPADLVSRRQVWEKDGWTSYNPAAQPYTPEQRRAELDRLR